MKGAGVQACDAPDAPLGWTLGSGAINARP